MKNHHAAEFINFFYSVYGSNPEIKCIDQKPDISLDNDCEVVLSDILYFDKKSPELRILKINLSPASPYLPLRVEMFSMAGVSIGA